MHDSEDSFGREKAVGNHPDKERRDHACNGPDRICPTEVFRLETDRAEIVRRGHVPCSPNEEFEEHHGGKFEANGGIHTWEREDRRLQMVEKSKKAARNRRAAFLTPQTEQKANCEKRMPQRPVTRNSGHGWKWSRGKPGPRGYKDRWQPFMGKCCFSK